MEIMDDQKISVAMFCPYFLPAYGGAELATFNLARELRMLCDVKLYTFNWTQNLDLNKNYELNFSCGFPEQEIVNGVPIYRYSVANLPIVKNFSVKLIKDLKFSDIDIIHFQGATRLFSRLLLQKAVKNKIKILTTHGFQESVEIARRSKLSALINPFFLHSLKTLDHIIALSNADVNSLLYLGINKNKITLIPNGIDVTKFKNRRKFVKRNEKMKILCVARFDKNKNYESLVYALSKLKDDLEFEAYFIGAVTDYKYFKKIMRLIKKNGLEKFVNIDLSLDDPAVVDCYLSCDLFVLPSNMETFPLVILEAMYAGLPIIATHVGCIPDIVKNEVNGFVIPTNDPVKLYKKCLQLLKNEKMRKDMGTINKEMARNYTWSRMALSTYNLYQQLMEEHLRK
ncbi:MAG: glycosyltransferase family 4 protein [Candidatus Helarchaeota archaeon]|nr:glycosyltransferase family 4 protein [Candidatus Helarchaeota archaeon]